MCMPNQKEATAIRFHSRLWAVCFGLLLTAFTAYVLLDTFVLRQVYSLVAPQGNAGGASEENPSAVITETSYTDENISIVLSEYREYDSTIYVADIRLNSADYLQTALADSAYGKNVTAPTSQIARKSGAILAINGDYYGAQETGYVLRNGVLCRSSASAGQEDLVIWADGAFSVITEGEISAEELAQRGAQQILSFGPALVLEGSVAVSQEEEVVRAKARNPRTALAVIEPLHYLFVVSDGRTAESEGLSLYELAAFLQQLDAQTAYNLDGGGSSTLYFNGVVINSPTTNGREIQERSVSDIVCIGY